MWASDSSRTTIKAVSLFLPGKENWLLLVSLNLHIFGLFVFAPVAVVHSCLLFTINDAWSGRKGELCPKHSMSIPTWQNRGKKDNKRQSEWVYPRTRVRRYSVRLVSSILVVYFLVNSFLHSACCPSFMVFHLQSQTRSILSFTFLLLPLLFRLSGTQN